MKLSGIVRLASPVMGEFLSSRKAKLIKNKYSTAAINSTIMAVNINVTFGFFIYKL
jgi:hypothetical protein